MNFEIRQAGDQDIAEIVRLSLVAWEPVFNSFKQVLGPGIFALIFPDWRTMQTETVETYSKAREDRTVWVAEVEGQTVGHQPGLARRQQQLDRALGRNAVLVRERPLAARIVNGESDVHATAGCPAGELF